MTIKIPHATYNDGGEQWTAIPTTTYRKLMVVVREADKMTGEVIGKDPLSIALYFLRKHLKILQMEFPERHTNKYQEGE